MSSDQETLHLSVLDQQLHIRVYTRKLLIFPFGDTSQTNNATEALRTGLAAAISGVPYLAGSIRPSITRPHEIEVLYPKTVDVEACVKELFDSSTNLINDSHFTFSELEQSRFASSLPPCKELCPAYLRNHPGLDEGDQFAAGRTTLVKRQPIPVMGCKAVFTPGTLILSVYIHHSLFDGGGALQIFEVWSKTVRALSAPQIPTAGALLQTQGFAQGELASQQIPTTSCEKSLQTRDGLDKMASGTRRSTPDTLSSHRATPKLRTPPYTVFTKLFSISLTTVDTLRAALESTTNLKISRIVTLAALFWSHIVRARSAVLFNSGTNYTKLAVVADTRKVLGPPFEKGYLGNLALLAISTYPVPSVKAHDATKKTPVIVGDLAKIATDIRASIKTIDKHWVIDRLKDLTHTATSNSNVSTAEPSDLVFSNGPDLYLTSWLHHGADLEWNIPGTTSSKPAAIRRPKWAGEGGIVVLPRQMESNNSFEVLVGLSEKDLENLEQEMVNGGWVDGVFDACDRQA